MDIEGVTEVCDKLGLYCGRASVSEKFGPYVMISCPLAPWSHSDPLDKNKSCGVLLDADGPSSVTCFSFSCGYQGSLWYVVQRAVLARDPAVQAMFAEWVARIAKTEEPSLERDFERTTKHFDTAYETGTVPTVQQPRPPRAVAAIMPQPRASMPRTNERDVLDERFLDQFSSDLPPYVAERGIELETAKRWELRYDERTGRLVFPCRRFDGRLIGVTGRILPSREAEYKAKGQEVTKYHNYSGLNKSRYLYGAHSWKKGRPVVLSEGPFDLLKTWQAIGDKVNVGATLGQGFGEDHRRTVKCAEPDAVYLFFDDDNAGRRAAEKVGAQMEDAMPIRLMRPQGGKDPGEMTEVAISAAFDNAIPIIGDIVRALAGIDPLA